MPSKKHTNKDQEPQKAMLCIPFGKRMTYIFFTVDVV